MYDAWGKVTSVTGTDAETVGKYNSLRYRGYYYDTETGMYYLQSRYYDPGYKRFINADDPTLITDLTQASALGGNLFAYCENNAVNDSDPTGNVRLSWKQTVCLGVIFTLFKIGFIAESFKSINKMTKNKWVRGFAKIHFLGVNIASEIINFISKAAVVTAVLSVIISFVASCFSGGISSAIKFLIDVVICYFLPSLIDCILMIYRGIRYHKRCDINATWRGTKVKFL